MPVSLPEFSADVRQRLGEYLDQHPDETKGNIASAGLGYAPARPEDDALFPLVCAVDQLSDDDPFTYLHLADACLGNGDSERAANVYRYLEGTAWLGYQDESKFHLAWMAFDGGNLDEALGFLNALVEARPSDQGSLSYYRAIVLHRMGEFERARAQYDAYLECVGRARSEVLALRTDAAGQKPFDGNWTWPVESGTEGEPTE